MALSKLHGTKIDVDFPDKFDVFIQWLAFRGEETIADWLIQKDLADKFIFRYFAYKLGFKDLVNLEKIILLDPTYNYYTIRNSIIWSRRYINSEFLEKQLKHLIYHLPWIKSELLRGVLQWFGEDSDDDP